MLNLIIIFTCLIYWELCLKSDAESYCNIYMCYLLRNCSLIKISLLYASNNTIFCQFLFVARRHTSYCSTRTVLHATGAFYKNGKFTMLDVRHTALMAVNGEVVIHQLMTIIASHWWASQKKYTHHDIWNTQLCKCYALSF